MQNDPASNFKADTMLYPVVLGAATTAQDTVIDATGFRYAYVILSIGAASAGAADLTLDFNVEAAATSGGTGVDITGAVFNLLDVGNNDDSTYVGQIDLQGQDVFLSGDIVTAGTATVSVAVSVTVVLTQAEDSSLATAATWSV